MRNRHLARPEATDLHALLQFAEPRIDLGGKVGLREHDLEFALKAFASGLCYLHNRTHISFFIARNRRAAFAERNLVPRSVGVVRAEGLEPPRLSPREPKSRASTN